MQHSCGHKFADKQQLEQGGNVSCFATLEATTPRKLLRKQRTEARSTERGASRPETDIADSGGRGARVWRWGLRASSIYIGNCSKQNISRSDITYLHTKSQLSGFIQIYSVASRRLTREGAMGYMPRCVTHQGVTENSWDTFSARGSDVV